MQWQNAVMAAESSGGLSYIVGRLVGKLICCLVIPGGIVGVIVLAVRSSRSRSTSQNFSQSPYPPPGYYPPPPGHQPQQGSYPTHGTYPPPIAPQPEPPYPPNTPPAPPLP